MQDRVEEIVAWSYVRTLEWLIEEGGRDRAPAPHFKLRGHLKLALESRYSDRKLNTLGALAYEDLEEAEFLFLVAMMPRAMRPAFLGGSSLSPTDEYLLSLAA